LDGNQVSLSDFKGKPVLIVFWATWWQSCREELSALEKFSQDRRDNLVFLFITIDGERKRAAQKIINQNKITLPVLLLLKEKTMDQYGVRGWVPQIFLVDQEGILVGKIIGERDWSSLEAWSCMKELFGLRWQIPEIFVSMCWYFVFIWYLNRTSEPLKQKGICLPQSLPTGPGPDRGWGRQRHCYFHF
jgi:thiol-disulfide isomerase/thioredoxin